LKAIRSSLAVIRRALEITELSHLSSYCDSVERVTMQLAETPTNLDVEGLAMLEQTSLALRVASQLGGDSTVTAAEISDAVAGVSSKNDDLVRSVVG